MPPVPLKVLAFNCSLKSARDKEKSSTDVLLKQMLEAFEELGAKGEIVRAVDHNIKPGVTSNEGRGDAWPKLCKRVIDADILVIGTPVWLGQPSSVAKRVLERMDAFLDEKDERGRMPSYGKVAIAVVVGNEDGAHHCAADGGEQIAYDRLLVATGGRNRPLTGRGTALEGLFQLRTVEDCDRNRAAARAGARVVVVGLGFIGSEVAASLRQLGLEVAAVEGHPVPLARVLGEEVGKVLADIHRENGVDLALGDSVAAFEGDKRVERVRTKNGRRLECDLVVAGIGIMPNSELLAASGAAVDNGVLVDERCRTSLPDVYAAGDVANHLHPVFGRLRVEHWNNGYQQGRAAARSMLGRDQPYDYLHSFWSNQYDHVIEYVGFAARWDRLVFRGRPESRKFLGFYLNDGVVRAAVGLNRGGDPEDPKEDGELKAVASLIRNRVPVDPARLANEDVDLRRLASPGTH